MKVAYALISVGSESDGGLHLQHFEPYIVDFVYVFISVGSESGGRDGWLDLLPLRA